MDASSSSFVETASDSAFGPGLQRSMHVENSYATDLEVSALQQMAYDSKITEDINAKMRMPEKLTVAKQTENGPGVHMPAPVSTSSSGYVPPSTLNMEVPERIVVSVGKDGVEFGESYTPHDLFLQEIRRGDQPEMEIEPLTLTTPPRKLTLAERDFNALTVASVHPSQEEELDSDDSGGLRVASPRNLMNLPMVPDVPQTDSSMEELDNITQLRRQVFKLHRRITLIEKQQAEKSALDVYFYGATIAFWLINCWFLYNRRPY